MIPIWESPNDAILQKDIETLAAEPILDGLSGRSVLVTGATGLIGSLAVKALACRNRLYGSDITIIALARSRDKFASVYGQPDEACGIVPCICDITKPLCIDRPVNYIIHGASVTSSKAFVEQPVVTIRTALLGTENVLELARSKKVSGMVYLSSLEVYGVTDPDMPYVTENDYGRIDPLSVRSSYSEGKRMTENLCVSYCSQYGVPVRIARLVQTFGAGVEYNDGRVFAQFARSVIEKKNIVLCTTGETLRSYCYTSDAVCGLIHILLKGESGQAYNVANRNTAISIRDMAKLICDSFPDAGISTVFDIAEDATKLGYNPPVKIRLDPTKLEQLGWRAKVDLPEMFKKMIDSLITRL